MKKRASAHGDEQLGLNDPTITRRDFVGGTMLGVAHSEVVNADGKRVVLATGSALLLPGRSASLVDLPIE
jgi:hypothetical protein